MNNFYDELDTVMYPATGLSKIIMDMELMETPRDCRWNIPIGILMHMQVDAGRLERAVQRLVDENDILRMLIYLKDGKPYLKFHKHMKFNLEVIDAIGETKEGRKKYIMEQADLIANTPMDIFGKEIFQVKLFKIHEDENLLFVNVNHAGNDVITLRMFVSILFKYYGNENLVLPQRSHSFSEYMIDEQEFLRTEKAARQMKYWSMEYKGFKALEFPMDKNAECIASHDIAPFSFNKKGLQNVAKVNQTSIFNIIFMIMNLVMAKIHNINDTSVNYTIAARENEKYKTTFGPVARCVGCRLTFDDNETIEALHKKVRAKLAKGFANYETADMFLQSEYFITYQTDAESTGNDKEAGIFDNKLFEFIGFHNIRRIPLLFVNMAELEDEITTSIESDTRVFSADYIKNFRDVCLEVEKAVIENPGMTFAELVSREVSEDYNIIMI